MPLLIMGPLAPEKPFPGNELADPFVAEELENVVDMPLPVAGFEAADAFLPAAGAPLPDGGPSLSVHELVGTPLPVHELDEDTGAPFPPDAVAADPLAAAAFDMGTVPGFIAEWPGTAVDVADAKPLPATEDGEALLEAGLVVATGIGFSGEVC